MKKQLMFEVEETHNAILGALSSEEASRLAPHLRPIELTLGQEVAQAGEMADEVIFPEAGMLSNILHSRQNVEVEVSVVGREGVYDALLALNDMPRIDRVLVQAQGWGWGLPTGVLREEFRRGGALQRRILRYFDLLYTQAAVSGMCNRLHTIEERLARWMLVVRSGSQSDQFPMPTEFVAAMLGSRSSGVPVALGVLQRSGMIMVDQNIVHLLDVPALEGTACECHAVLSERLRLYLQPCDDAQRPILVACA